MKRFIFFARVLTLLTIAIPMIGNGQNLEIYPHYVVIGAFASEKNATFWTNDANAHQYTARYEINPNRNLFYVYILSTSNREIAFSEALKLRKETKYWDTWVYNGLLGEAALANPLHRGQDFRPDAEKGFLSAESNSRDGDIKADGLSHPINEASGQQNGTVTQDVSELTAPTSDQPSGKKLTRKERRNALLKAEEDKKALKSPPDNALTDEKSDSHTNDNPVSSGNVNIDRASSERQSAAGNERPVISSEQSGNNSSKTKNNLNNGRQKNGIKNEDSELTSGLSANESFDKTGQISSEGQEQLAANPSEGTQTSNGQERSNNSATGKNLSRTGQTASMQGQNEALTGEAGSLVISGQTTAQGQAQLAANTNDGNQSKNVQDRSNNSATGDNVSRTGQKAGMQGQNQSLTGEEPSLVISGQTTAQGQDQLAANANDGTQSKNVQDRGNNSTPGNNFSRTGPRASIQDQSQSLTGEGTSSDGLGPTTEKGQEQLAANADQTALIGNGRLGNKDLQTGNNNASANGDNTRTKADPTQVALSGADSDLPSKDDSALTEAKGSSTEKTRDDAGMDVSTSSQKLPEKPENAVPLTSEEVVGKNFFFKLVRASNNEIVHGEVDAIDFEHSRRMATYEGNTAVKVLMPPGKPRHISFICQVFGYRKLQKEFEPNNPSEELFLDEGGNLVVPFELVRLQRGDIAIMYNVFFFKDAAVMRPESRYEVNNLLELLNENPLYKIRIHGHTNGNAAGKIIRMGKSGNFYSLTETKEGFGSSKKLSEERADVMRQFLISKGISEDRMEIKAWGGKKPIHDKNAVRANENVRVEIEILSE